MNLAARLLKSKRKSVDELIQLGPQELDIFPRRAQFFMHRDDMRHNFPIDFNLQESGFADRLA